MDIRMPQLGETVTEGTITRWLKHVGDRVETDEPLFEVSTDKVDSEVPAPSAGVVSEILVQEGETAEVGARLAVLSDAAAGAAAPASAPAAAPEAPAPAAPAPAPPAPAAPAPAPPAPAPAPAPPPPREPVAPPAAATAPPATPPAPPAPAPPVAPSPPPAPAPLPAAPAGPVMSPVVRRLLNEYGLDANEVRGTGEGGRITRNDVLDAAARKPAASAPVAPVPAAPAPAPAPPPASAPVTPAPPVEPRAPVAPPRLGGDETIPFDNIRRRTAEHMVSSKATSPHVYTSIEVDYERVERARRAVQAEWKAREGFSLTYLPFIVRAFCDTVEEYPNLNASVDGDNLVVHHDIHVGIAVDLDFRGLIAPVVRDADGKRLRLIAREIHDLAGRARNKQLMPDEIMGGTFTITNPGPWGTYITLPIINQPQVAILSTDGIRKRPWVMTGRDGEDSIAIRHVGILALTWDHRAFDGAYAAAFLRGMKETLETHDWQQEVT